jgi:pyruvate,water dikinase
VLPLDDVAAAQIALVGGKGAQLGELTRIEGVRVPPGFCVTTAAFRRVMAAAGSIDRLLDELSLLSVDEREAIGSVSAKIGLTIEETGVPDDVAAAIVDALGRDGPHDRGYAVRSSATAEDLPEASFAGQQDSYLNVVGSAEILRHVSRCWASLFTERAVTYRLRNGVDHRNVQMAVVVQQTVFADAAGVLFTADPVTANRKVATVEATFGLGDALVAGAVNPDAYQVRGGEIIRRSVTRKPVAVHAAPAGGTQTVEVDAARQTTPALTDAQVLRLVELGRRIEAHFGHPQDIEWCLVDDDFQIVQSRAITTLFPIPDAGDDEYHVYVSVGHQQMMTDPMKPLGFSVFQLTAAPKMYEAGGRLFVDVAPGLASPSSRAGLLDAIGRGDPLIGNALQRIVERGDLIAARSDRGPDGPAAGAAAPRRVSEPIETDPAIVTGLIDRQEASIATLERDILPKSGPELFEFILADIQELKRLLFEPLNYAVIMAGMEATWWLNDQLQDWLGEKNAADVLTQSLPDNVTSAMGLELLDVADVIRPHPDVVAFLRDVEHRDVEHRDVEHRDDDEDTTFLEELPGLPGGREARDAIEAYLDKYGMRCVGEIDITRPRWREQPAALVPAILGNIENASPGAGQRRFEEGRQNAWRKEQDVLRRLRALPDGERKADEAKRMIDRARTFNGYREYPKYGIVRRYFAYKQALLNEAARLVRSGVLRDERDCFWLTFQQFHDVAVTGHVDQNLIDQRKDAFRSYRALTPPRVMTSDGEIVAGSYQRDDVPPGALVGLPVSAGTVEGRARVIADMAHADLEPGDILVTAYTDPSWSPLFVSISGLVTEVGGLMTHGAVIAREYGLPAVVGVEHATKLITDGQRIRVDGTDGYVEILDARRTTSST